MIGPYELNTIVTGDARELAQAIPDESVDLIFTDPLYDQMTDYKALAEIAKRVLKPNSAALVWCGIGYLPETIQALQDGGLFYRWQLVSVLPMGFYSQYCMNKVFSNWQSLLWFENSNSRPVETISDVTYQSSSNKHMHAWNKNITPVSSWLYRFTKDGDLVFDPFTGSGTVPAVCKMLGRNYLAFEIDPDTADKARERVANTQPPLFVPQHEQLELTP